MKISNIMEMDNRENSIIVEMGIEPSTIADEEIDISGDDDHQKS